MSETHDIKQQAISHIAPLLTYVWPEQYVRLYSRRLARCVQKLPSLQGLPDLDLGAGLAPAILSTPENASAGDSTVKANIQDILSHSKHIIIFGGLGSGKTTLLRALGWQVAYSVDSTTAEQVPVRLLKDQEGFLPILIDLAHSAHGSKPPFDLLFDSLGNYGLPATRSFLRACLQQGKCILLCDNLHCLSDPEQRAQLAEMVGRFANNRWIMAQRPTTWTMDLPGFSKVSLHGTDGPTVDRLAGERSADLTPLNLACERNAALRDLARVPLMAAAMVRQVLSSSGSKARLPDLYEACLTTCLDEWCAEDCSGARAPTASQTAVLQAIAYEMQQARTWTIDGAALEDLLAKYPGLPADSALRAWLDRLVSEGGILGPVVEGTMDLSFFAPSMQSYLAARQILSVGRPADVLPFLDVPEWHDTVVLLASMLTDPIPLLEQIATWQAREPEKWLLLAHCIAEVEGDTASIRSVVEERLSAVLEDSDSGCWCDTLTTLAGMAHTRVRNYVESALQGRDVVQKRRAIVACGWLREQWSTPYLSIATTEADLGVALQAVRVLGRIPSAQSARFLARAFREVVPQARTEAASSLVALGRTDPKLVSYVVTVLVEYLQNEDSELAQLAEQSLLQLGRVAMPELGKILSDERLQQSRRVRVAQVLGNLGSEEALPLLIEATLRARLEDLDGYVQAIAAVGAQAVPALIAALEGKDVSRAAGLTRALIAIGAPSIEPLIEALGSAHPEVRNAAVRVLEQMPQFTIQPLTRILLVDSRLEIRKPALEILGRIGTEEVISAFIRALGDQDPVMRRNAARYLGRFGNPLAISPLLDLFKTEADSSMRRIVLSSLGEIRDGHVIPVLLASLGDPTLRDVAEKGLLNLSPLTIEPLIEVVHQPQTLAEVRETALGVLESASHGTDPQETGPLGLASTYVQLTRQKLTSEQMLDLLERFTWWGYQQEMSRSLRALLAFAGVQTLEEASGCQSQLDFLQQVKQWLRPSMLDILSGFATVGENIAVYLQMARREGQRDALLSSLSKLDELAQAGQASLLPFEVGFLDQAIEHWRSLIREAQSTLVGRAALSCEVLTPQLPMRRSQRGCTAAFRLLNEGDSVARKIAFSLRPAAATELDIVDGSQRNLDPLGIGEGRQIEITLAPHGVRRAEFQLEVQYDDDEQSGRWYRSGFHIEFYDAPTDYRPIPTNPYVVGPPVQEPQMFYGRQDIVNWVRENISSQYQENVLLLYGERRIGKTSVLHHLLREPPTPRHICLFFDLQLFNYLEDVPSFLRELASEMARRLQEAGLDMPQPETQRFGADAYGAFLAYCRQIDTLLDQRRFLIMFDEFGALLAKVRAGVFEPTLFDFMRGIIQSVRHFNFLFAGAYEMRLLQKDYGSILFNLAKVCKVSYLEQSEAEQLIEKPLEGFLSYHPLVVQQVCSFTACHPYFVQYICASLVERARKARRNYVELADLNWVIRDVVRDATGNIKDSIYRHLSDEEKIALAALATLTDDVRLYAPFSDLITLLERRRLAMPRDHLMAALESLGERELISETRMGQQLRYAFRMDLVRLWLRQNEMLLRLAQERAV